MMNEDRIETYRKMLVIHLAEERIQALFGEGVIFGTCHLWAFRGTTPSPPKWTQEGQGRERHTCFGAARTQVRCRSCGVRIARRRVRR